MTKARKVLKFRYNLLYACITTSCIDVNYFASTWKLCQKHGVIHTRGVRWFDFKCKYHFCEVSFLLRDIDGKYFAFPNFLDYVLNKRFAKIQ